ncbi:MAG: hypothetical protein HC824_11665 [Synechococcales cyanobacterium RM1_1_8]|nr:hypothetical protein [Synechococcales cyanobacterium RM1_1_8]
MARKIHSRIRIKGQLKVMRSLHVGGIHGDVSNVDLSLAVNGQGQVYIPGTSLAGAIRSYMTQVYDDHKSVQTGPTKMDGVWGYQEKDRGHASFIVVEDAVVSLPSGEAAQPRPMQPRDMEIRDGVGINRHSGTAAENFKFNRAIIPRNATLPLNLTLEVKDEDQQAELEAQLNNTLAALSQGLIRLGGAKSRGLGCIQLEPDCEGEVQLLSSRDGLLKLLQQKANDPNEQALPLWPGIPKEVANAPAQLKLTIEWEPVGPVMVKSEQSGVAVDILPLMSRFDAEHLGFVLPGSSIKGTLRSQAERILRTVLQQPLPADKKFADQVQQLPLACHLFGTAAQSEQSTDKRDNPDDPKLGASALFIEDCFSQQSYDSKKFAALTTADKPEIRSALDAVDAENIQQAYHVAIDRWTGGAADQFLYTAIEPFNITWEPIEIGLRLDRLLKKEQEPAIALLLLLLRDFAHQRIPLGYGVNRGYGTVKLRQATIQLQGLDKWPEHLQPLNGVAITQADLSELGELRQTLSTAWGDWIVKHQVHQEAA